MSVFEKIQDAYFIYCSLDKNIILLKQFSNVSEATLKKYIIIYENLDVRLFPYLDNKKKKLSIDLALDLCKKTLNHDTQYKMFIDLFKKTVKENKIILRENSCCLICCEDSNYIHAPLVKLDYDEEIVEWYDPDIIKENLPENYDLILIDGPAGKKGRTGFLANIDLFNLLYSHSCVK